MANRMRVATKQNCYYIKMQDIYDSLIFNDLLIIGEAHNDDIGIIRSADKVNIE